MSIIISDLSGVLNIKDSLACFDDAIDANALFSIVFDAQGAGLVASGVAATNHGHALADLGAAAANHGHALADLGAAAAVHSHAGYINKINVVTWTGDGITNGVGYGRLIPFSRPDVNSYVNYCIVFGGGRVGIIRPGGSLIGVTGNLAFASGFFLDGAVLGNMNDGSVMTLDYPASGFRIAQKTAAALINALNVVYVAAVIWVTV